MKTIKGDLIMKEDTEFKESIIVNGNISGGFNLKVEGDIVARDIVAGDIDARDIDAWDILCVSRKKKTKDSKTIAYSLVTDRFNREKKEQMPTEADEL